MAMGGVEQAGAGLMRAVFSKNRAIIEVKLSHAALNFVSFHFHQDFDLGRLDFGHLKVPWH